jgi:hypothetical protein
MKMLEILEQQERRDFGGIMTGDESWSFLEYSRNRAWRLGNENSPERISQKLTRKNICSESSGAQQNHWLRIGYQEMHHLIAHTSARSLSHAEQVLRFRIRQDSANDEFLFTWIIPDLTIQGSHSNLSRTTSSKACLFRHIPQVLRQEPFIFSAL